MSVLSSHDSATVRQSLASIVQGRAASAGSATTAIYRHISDGSYERALVALRAVRCGNCATALRVDIGLCVQAGSPLSLHGMELPSTCMGVCHYQLRTCRTERARRSRSPVFNRPLPLQYGRVCASGRHVRAPSAASVTMFSFFHLQLADMQGVVQVRALGAAVAPVHPICVAPRPGAPQGAQALQHPGIPMTKRLAGSPILSSSPLPDSLSHRSLAGRAA